MSRFVEIGRTGRPHGVKGELKVHIEEVYQEDFERAGAVLIGTPPVPYFIQRRTGGGAPRIKLETFDSREAVSLLSNRDIFLPEDQITVEVSEEDTPWDVVLGYTIQTENYPELGPIEAIVDLPEHYLAEITHDERTVLIPLHDDLVLGVDQDNRRLQMELPDGLLDIN